MAESVLVGTLSAAIAVLSLYTLGSFALPETAAIATLAGAGAGACMRLGQG